MSSYLDSSAISKLILAEPESTALRNYLGDDPRMITSRVAVVEVTRAVRRQGLDIDLGPFLGRMSVLELDRSIASRASTLHPPSLRTLDAIHIATVLELDGEIDGFVTYDLRQADAARSVGLPVVSPGTGGSA